MSKIQLGEPTYGEFNEQESAAFTALEHAAEARYAEQRVNMRWNGAALDVVKHAAALHGVPYQTYVKQVAYRQALTDLKDAQSVGLS